MENEQLELWDSIGASDISVEQLDDAARAYAKAREDYEQKKSISNEAFHHQNELKNRLISMLKAANKKRYSVDGVGNLTVVEKLKVRAPQSIEDKQAFYDWVESTYGAEARLLYSSINHNTLNSMYNQIAEEAAAKGQDFHIPGVSEPESETNLQLRKS